MVKPYIFNKHLDMNKQLNLNNETGFLLVLVGLSFFLPMGRIIDSDLSFFIYCCSCYWARSGYMGLYFRDIPKSSPQFGAGIWRECSLGFSGNYSFLWTAVVFKYWCGISIFNFCLIYGPTTDICALCDARNERDFIGKIKQKANFTKEQQVKKENEIYAF